MARRWTLKELQSLSDVNFISGILEERKHTCTNPYAPLTERINATQNRLEKHGDQVDDILQGKGSDKKVREILEKICNSFETAGCDGCGTVSTEVIDEARQCLGWEKPKECLG